MHRVYVPYNNSFIDQACGQAWFDMAYFDLFMDLRPAKNLGQYWAVLTCDAESRFFSLF